MGWKKQVSLGLEISILMGLSVLIFLSGVIGKSFFMIFVGMLFLMFTLANQYYLKRVADELTFEVDKQLIKLFKGEKDEFTLIFSQKGRLPIFNANVRITVDNIADFQFKRDMFSLNNLNYEQAELQLPLSVLGRQSVSYKIPFEAKKRGVLKIRTIEIRVPHLFGFGDVYLQYNQPVDFETIIYASPTSVGGVEKIAPKNQGDYPLKHSYFEDMAAIVGARGYVSSDPFNRIHWKASARTNQLQTKLYERTAQFSWTILVNVRDGKLEELLGGLTYLLEYATVKNISYELFVNVRKAGKTPYIHVQMGSGKEHLQKTLELIARLSKHSVTVPFHQMVYAIERQSHLSPYVIFVGSMDENEERILKGLQRRGVDTYQLKEHEEAVFLSKSSAQGRRMKAHAI
ncbi:DUF58 domain-containing protein [Bacillus timonensis]|nr:DUF58 domain-containing protein [Bacillus timonensis]